MGRKTPVRTKKIMMFREALPQCESCMNCCASSSCRYSALVSVLAVPKPFVEMSVVERLAEHTLIKQYKYCKMLIQEFHVKLDQGFLSALMGVLSVDKLNKNTVGHARVLVGPKCGLFCTTGSH